jgi:predicted SnoaL-like aldol condensation-catalyzing enzyme
MTLLKTILLSAVCAATIASASEPTDMENAKTPNAQLVLKYIHLRFDEGKETEAARLYQSPNFIDHGWLGRVNEPPPGPNPSSAERPGDGHIVTFDVKKVLTGGDLVFIQAIAHNGPGNGDLAWALFRVKNGKIAEHWDTHNHIPDDQVGKQI